MNLGRPFPSLDHLLRALGIPGKSQAYLYALFIYLLVHPFIHPSIHLFVHSFISRYPVQGRPCAYGQCSF